MLLNSSNLNPSLCVTSSGVERLTCFCCQSSTRTPVRRTPWQLHDSTSDVFYVSSESYFDCSSMLQLASFLFLGHDGLFTKNHARSIIFRPSSDQQNPQEKNDCFHQISNWDLWRFIGYQLDYRPSHRPSETTEAHGIMPAQFHGWSTTRLLHKKKYPYLYTVLYHSTEPLYYST